MDNQQDKPKGRVLTKEEKEEQRIGQQLYEMTQTSGWQVLRQMLEDRAYHSWVDPRETGNEKEWIWRELNAFHSADVAKQLIDDISKLVNRADYLGKVESGEIQDVRRMKI